MFAYFTSLAVAPAHTKTGAPVNCKYPFADGSAVGSVRKGIGPSAPGRNEPVASPNGGCGYE
jgi:hypothetical protein